MTRIDKFRNWAFSNWPIKLTALVLATVLWAVIAAQETTSQMVPVHLDLQAPEGRAFISELPQVQARFVGTLRELIKLYESPPTIRRVIPDTIAGNTYAVELTTDEIEVLEGANVIAQELQPSTFSVTLDDVMQRDVRVVSRVRIIPDSGFGRFGEIRVTPAMVTLRGPEALVTEIQSVSTMRVDTNAVTEPVALTVPLDTTGLGVVRIQQDAVVVSADIGPESQLVIMGVAVRLPGADWMSTPSAVIVTVRGPSSRVIGLTRDSVRVEATPSGSSPEETVRLTVVPPIGIVAEASPDSVVVQRRTSG